MKSKIGHSVARGDWRLMMQIFMALSPTLARVVWRFR